MREYTHDETISWLSSLEKRMSSAGIALYDANGRVLVVKAHYKKYWSFPGGVIDAGETPREAAVRETHEEVGITVDDSTLRFCMIVNRVSIIAQTYQFIFDCEVDSPVLDVVTLDGVEMEDYALVSREDILAGDRYYSKSTVEWARGYTGYLEQQFGAAHQQADI
ncbi:MAG TPA: NUDIX hydrolase [Candidatus Saccharimonadaceae bacterium]|nr:NUDIX hydrolase [Candidatus Saccharimonadaceae bacterium]